MLGFLGAVVLATTGLVPQPALDVVHGVERLVLIAALISVGIGVDISAVRRLGTRPLALGAAAWALITVLALATTTVLELT